MRQSPRPIKTAYYRFARDRDGAWTKVSHSSAIPNAAQAAFRRLVSREYEMAKIENEDGIVVATIKRQPGGSILTVGV